MLCVYDVQGKLLLEKCWENAELSFPYVYRFSARDSRIGVMDGKGGTSFLVGYERCFQRFSYTWKFPVFDRFRG